MKHTARTFVLLALAGAVVAAAALAATGHHRKHHRRHAVAQDRGRLGPALFGFNDNSVLMQQTDPETAIQRSKAAGANVVRYTVNWDYVEAKQGEWNWRGYDPLYEAAIRNGIRPILIASFSPTWTRPLDLSCGAAYRDHCEDPPATKNDAAWVEFVSTLAKRYPKAAAIEIWNEPNLINFWHQGPDPERYAHLLNLAYDAIKQAEPSMRVLGGALSNTKYGGNGSTPYEPYINDLLALKPKFDALAIHDYDVGAPDDSSWFEKTLDIARSALDANGYKGVPLWVTEIGRSTTGPYAVTNAHQATRLAQMLVTLGARKDVQAALVHTLVPVPTGQASEEYGYSTMNPDGSPKTAFCLLAKGRRVKAPVGCGT